MTALINMPRAAWKRQPQGAVSLKPQYQNADHVFLGSTKKYGYGKENFTVNGNILYGGTMAGIGAYSTSNSEFNYFTLSDLSLSTAGWIGLTIVFSCISPSAINYQALSSCVLDNYFGGWNISWNSSTVLYVFTGNNGTPLSATVAAGEYLTGCLTWDFSTRSLSLSRNYKKQSVQQSSSTTGFVSGNLIRSVGGYRRYNNGTYRTCNTPVLLAAVFPYSVSVAQAESFSENPWQLFINTRSRFYLIPSGGGATTYTTTLSIDALIQRAGLTQSTTIDALLQSAFSTSFSLDSLIAAVQSETLSLDALLQIVGTRTVSVDALLQATKSGAVSVDALVQMTLAQNLSLDALIQALQTAGVSLDALLSTAGMQSVVLDALLQSGETGSVSLDGFIQAIQTKTLSLDALLSKSMSAAAVMDALIQSSKTGAVSLDALITGSSATTIFTGLDALIQAIQSKTLSVDALLQKTYTNPLSLDAYVSLTQIKTVSLDALLQNTKTGVISMDAILQMTKTAMVSFDALIQAAKTGILSLDAILVFATQASVLLDAYVQKAVLRGVGLDAIIGAIADMVMPTGRVVAVPASDRWVFVTPSDRFIQV